MRIMYLSWSIPPSPTGSSTVAEGIAEVFSPEEMVMCGEWPDVGHDLDPETNNGRYVYLSREGRWPKRGKRYFRWTRWLGFPFFFMKIVLLSKKEACDTIFVVYPDEFYLSAGWILHRISGFPLYVWFHNAYAENCWGLSRWYARWLQRRIFKDAREIFAISEGLSRRLNEYYPIRNFLVLPHFVSLWKRSTTDGGRVISPTAPALTVHLVMVGSLNKSCLDAVRRICRAIQTDNRIFLDIYSGTPQWVFQKFECTGVNIKHCGYLPEESFRRTLEQYNIALLPLGLSGELAKIEYETIFPTRALDLLISGVPILAHVPKDSFLEEFLISNDCAEIVTDSDEQVLRNAIWGLAKSMERQKQLVQNATKTIQMFDNRVLSKKLRGYLGC